MSDTRADTTVLIAVLANVTAAIVLFGIACSVEPKAFKAAWSHKSAAIIGLASQWLVMPGMACAFARSFDMGAHLAFTLICVGCAPGGTSSNTLAYFAAGDQALSIFLTSVTNLMALGTLPFFLWAWTSWAALSIRIPYEQVVLSLFVVLVPAGAGVLLRARCPRVADVCERVGAALGAIVTLLTIAVAILGNREALTTRALLPAGAWVAVALAAPSGMCFALVVLGLLSCVRRACRGQAPPAKADERSRAPAKADDACATKPSALTLDVPQCVTVVLETGIQNVPLALAVINVTLASGAYSADEVLGAQLLAAMWSAITTTQGVVVVLLSRWQQGRPICPSVVSKSNGSRMSREPAAAA